MFNLFKNITTAFENKSVKNVIMLHHNKDKQLSSRIRDTEINYDICSGQLKQELGKISIQLRQEKSKNTTELIKYCEGIVINESLSLDCRVFAQYTLTIL